MEPVQTTEKSDPAPSKRGINLEWFSTAEIVTLRVFFLTKLVFDVGEMLLKSLPR